MVDELLVDTANQNSIISEIGPVTDADNEIIDRSGAEIYLSNDTGVAQTSTENGTEPRGADAVAAIPDTPRYRSVQDAAATAQVPGLTLGGLISATTTGILLNSPAGKLLSNTSDITAQTISQILGQTLGSHTQTYQNTLSNPLHDYDSYTYGLSLHLLTAQQYNTLVQNPYNTYIPQNVLIASAGKYSASFRRNPFFTDDFFFDNFSMRTVVNTTTRSRNSNLVECNFTIIEPNGFTFINRLLDAVQSSGGRNYLRQPYLMQIDFYGYKDGVDGNGPIAGQTKYIPITLVSMKSKVTARGTEYNIDAVPYNHQALNTTNVITPAAFQVKARTVQDLLGNGAISNSLINNLNTESQREQANRERLQESLAAGGLDPKDAEQVKQYLAKPAQLSGQFVASGLTDAINSYQQSLVIKNKAILVPNQYRVVFDAEIGNQLINPSQEANDVGSVASGGSSNQVAANNIKAAAGLPIGGIDWKAGVFNIKMGTPIDKVIDYAVRNSEYIRQQLANPNDNTGKDISQIQLKLGNSLRWYRIIPSIAIGQYDPSRDQYAYNITYYVKPWTVNTKHPNAPQGRTPGHVKQYDYIFTGQNRDVIDCDIDFDMLYYTQLTAFRNKMRNGETGGTDVPVNDTPTVGPNQYLTDRLQPIQLNYVAADMKFQNRTGPGQSSAIMGGEVQRDLMVSSRGDMINVKLKILGDPQLIKQDDLFYGQTSTNSFNQLTPNSSLYYDNGELYVYLNFQSPQDYNEETGLAVPGVGRYQYSEFSGIYKIVTVDNIFSKGKFEQTLDLVRLPISDQLRNQVTSARSRADSFIGQGLGQLTALPYNRFTGPRIIVNDLAAGGILALAGAAAANGGAGGLKGILGSVANQVAGQLINAAVGKVVKGITDTLSGGLSGVTAVIPRLPDGTVDFGKLYEFDPGALGTGIDIIPQVDLFNSDLLGGSADLLAGNDIFGGSADLLGDFPEFNFELDIDFSDIF